MALVIIQCKICKTPHDDHLQCDGCGYNFSLVGAYEETYKDGQKRHSVPWKFCPLCGLDRKEQSNA